MHKFAAILISFLSTIAVLAQNDALQDINTQVTETITEPEYDFAPDADSPNVEVAPLAVNAEDQDVPLQPTVTENIEVNVEDKTPESTGN